MKRPSHSTCSVLRIVGLAALLATLSACGDKSSAPGQGQADSTGAAPPPAQPAPPGPPGNVASPDIKPQAVAKLPSYAPTEHEVRQAFHALLVQKAMTLQPGEQRDKWFMEESRRIKGIQVGKCTAAEIGTPAKCFISVSGKSVELQLLLTQSGWLIVG